MERSEIAALKSLKTTETGKILMTINNLHHKCDTLRKEMIISKKDYEESGTQNIVNYDHTGQSCKKAIEQLKIVK